MASKIKIENFWPIHDGLLIGLFIESNEKFPIVVGCSLQTKGGEIVDIPARYLLSPGFSLWGREKVDKRFKYPENAQYLHDIYCWNGRIIFALYSDDSFSNRIADTGWISWESTNLFGSSTGRHLDDRDEEIKNILDLKFAGRQNEIWAKLKDRGAVNVWKSFL